MTSMTGQPGGSPLAVPAAWDLVAGDYAAELVPFFERFGAGPQQLFMPANLTFGLKA